MRERIKEIVDFAKNESPYQSANKGWIADDIYLQWGAASPVRSLNETDELSTIINYLSNNYSKLNYINNQKTLETIEVLNNFLSIEEKITGIDSYNIIIDDRSMPSYFLIKDIKNNIKTENNLSLFLLTLISMDNKNWDELHPEHLKIILNALNSYDQGSLIKPIILEILNELNII